MYVRTEAAQMNIFTAQTSKTIETILLTFCVGWGATSHSWIFCFTFLLLKHTVSVQHVPVEGFIGKSVNLTCSLGPKQTTVFWRYNDSRTVCDISDGEARCKDQDPVYKDRVKITNGNFSIMLSNLTETDAGLYTCNSNSLPEQILELTVKAANGESPRRADGLLTFLLGCASLYTLTF